MYLVVLHLYINTYPLVEDSVGQDLDFQAVLTELEFLLELVDLSVDLALMTFDLRYLIRRDVTDTMEMVGIKLTINIKHNTLFQHSHSCREFAAFHTTKLSNYPDFMAHPYFFPTNLRIFCQIDLTITTSSFQCGN